jgi:hypothetical protein
MVWQVGVMVNLFIRSSRLYFMASTVKETVMPVHEETEEDIKALLEGTDAARMQYKHGQGTQVAGIKELDAFLDSLYAFFSMVRKRSPSKPKPDQATTDNPYSLFFPDDVRNQLLRMLCRPVFDRGDNGHN